MVMKPTVLLAAYNGLPYLKELIASLQNQTIPFYCLIQDDGSSDGTMDVLRKLTEEDWRNREKWPQYEEAIDEMLQKTSTENAPWYIIESNDKRYARIKTLKNVIKALEKACEESL